MLITVLPHNFAHDTTAVLSWHVQNFEANRGNIITAIRICHQIPGEDSLARRPHSFAAGLMSHRGTVCELHTARSTYIEETLLKRVIVTHYTCYVVFRKHDKTMCVYSFLISFRLWDSKGCRNPSPWKTKTRIYYIVNTSAAKEMA